MVERFADDQRTRADADHAVGARRPSSATGIGCGSIRSLTNLLANAVKYGAGQPSTSRSRARKASAPSCACATAASASAPPTSERIFGRFERAVSERHYGGLGLGLWIVRQIVEAHGGTITVRSTPGAETLFTVELPQR